MKTFIRTCQECGAEQKDKEPLVGVEPTVAFLNRKCKKCKSTSLDYGAYTYPNEKEPYGEALEDVEDDGGEGGGF